MLSIPSPPNIPNILTIPDADTAIRVSFSQYLGRLVSSLVQSWISTQASWTPGTVPNASFVSATLTMRGMAPPAPVAVGFTEAIPAGMVLHAVVTSPDTVTVTLINFTGAPQTIAAGTLKVVGSPTI